MKKLPEVGAILVVTGNGKPIRHYWPIGTLVVWKGTTETDSSGIPILSVEGWNGVRTVGNGYTTNWVGLENLELYKRNNREVVIPGDEEFLDEEQDEEDPDEEWDDWGATTPTWGF